MAYEKLNYETFYEGGYSSLNPDYGNFSGYRLKGSQISSPTGIQTANQINEVVSRIREGVKNVELQPISQDVFEQVPKQHLKEINALMKLTGVKASVHSPMIDPAGFGERGWEGDMAREDAERRLFSIVERSHKLDPDGNIPVVIHSTAGIPGTEWRPAKGTKPGEAGRFKEHKVVLINQETREMIPVEEEKRYFPYITEKQFKEGGMKFTPEKHLASINATKWDNDLTSLAVYKKHADEVLGDAELKLGHESLKPAIESNLKKLTPDQQKAYGKMRDANIFLENVQLNFHSMFQKAYKFGTSKQRRELKKLSDVYRKNMNLGLHQMKINGEKTWVPEIGYATRQKKLIDGAVKTLKQVTGGVNPITSERDKNFLAPKVYKPVEDFAIDKAAETFGNVAFKSYNKFKENSPIVAIENLYQGMAFSRAEDMEKLIKKSKAQFVKKAREKGLSKSVAKRQADKIIGMTWDVGHLNMMRKAGFTKKDIEEETKKIAKLVKHVHLTDNFGFSDSHLPPGMGNVPFKQILKQLEKAGALKDARAVIEAGPFVQHFKKSPFVETLKAMGSPIYGAKMAPYWNQVADAQGSYLGFPMAYMPEKHFSTYGSGFSSLPEELGGQIPGTQSRVSGTPNA